MPDPGAGPLRTAVDTFRAHGWCHLAGAVPAATCAQVRAAWASEVRPFAGALPRQLTQRWEGHDRSPAGLVRNAVVNPHHWSPLRFPRAAGAVARLLASGGLVELAAALLEAPPALLQAVWYDGHVGTEAHVDLHPVDPEAPIVGVWVALRGIAREAGPFWVVPGSHRVFEGVRGRRSGARAASLRAWRAQFVDHRPMTADERAVYQATWQDVADRWRLQAVVPALATGDVVAWRGDTLHGGGRPTRDDLPRSALALHFVSRVSVGL